MTFIVRLLDCSNASNSVHKDAAALRDPTALKKKAHRIAPAGHHAP